ncbi:MAG: chromate transporter [Clostridia bacterium]|nr:chromate transporter [Clostridia bacterium]
MIYLTLFLEFFKVGLFAVGGGLATIPFLMDMADRYEWLTREMLADMIAVSEATPGPIGVNMATYAGFQAAGVLGSLVATFALVLPSFAIVLIIAKFLDKYRQNKLVDGAFSGIRPAVTGLIAAAGFSVFRIALFTAESGTPFWEYVQSIDVPMLVLFVVVLAASNLKRIREWHPIAFIGLSAVAGVLINCVLR